MADPTDAPADPLVFAVGVTGHRNLHPLALASLHVQVTRAFERLEERIAPLRIVVLSALAEGADRLVAEIALERGHHLVAPLPLPPDEYEKDFVDDVSRAEFRQLLARAQSHFAIAAPRGEDISTKEGRDAAYRRAGILVARDCHLLLALWDGQDTGKPGGTWDVVRVKRTGDDGIVAGARQDRPEVLRGVIVHIHTPRADAKTVEVSTHWPAANEKGWRRLLSVCALTRRFNDDVANLRARAPEAIARSRTTLHDHELPDGCATALSGLMQLFAVADALANENQLRVRHAWRMLYGLGLLALAVFGLYAHGTHNHFLALAGYLATMAGAWLMYRRFELSEWHSRFLDYRAMAEALRVLFFWRTAGLPGDPFVGYAVNLAAEVEWVRQALRVEAARVSYTGGAGSAEHMDFVIKDWVLSQRKFYRTARERDLRRLKTAHGWGLGTIVAGIVLALVVLLLNVVDHDALVHHHETAHEWALILMPLLPAIGASLFSFAHRMGWEAQERQYERMTALFEPAVEALHAAPGDLGLRQEIVMRLAREALAEHAQWVLLHRQRPFEFIAGGG